MTNPDPKLVALAGTAAAAATRISAAPAQSVEEFITQIKDHDDKIRGPAWQGADNFGAPAVKPLADVMADPDMEIARAAKRALWKIVRHAGRPSADQEKRAVTAELLPLLQGRPTSVRRDVLWMLSEIGSDDAVPAVAALISEREVREDARAALERIPGNKSLGALKDGLNTAPEDFKPAIVQSLRVRGVKVPGYPSQKLVPTRSSDVNLKS